MRLFIGILPDQAAVAALHLTAKRLEATAHGRFLDPSLYHITLAFLGELTAGQVPGIRATMLRAAEDTAPFPITLGTVGVFGTILWRGIEDASALNLLASRIRTALDEAFIPYDKKPFSAHITLARDSCLPSGACAAAYPPATFTVGALYLFQSTRREGLLHYKALTEVPLE